MDNVFNYGFDSMKYYLMILAVTLAGISHSSHALDIPEIYFTPRITGGAMYYEYEQDPVESGFRTPDVDSREVDTKKMRFASLLATVSAGGTLNIDRFYIDAAIKHAFTERDDDSSRSSIRSEQTQEYHSNYGLDSRSVLIGSGNSSRQYDTTIERTEGAITTGYRAGNFTMFAGYKFANTSFRSHRESQIKITGTAVTVNSSGFVVGEGSAINELTEGSKADIDIDFKQKGPFIGFAYSVPIKRSIFSGSLSAKLAIAFMDGITTITETDRSYARTELWMRPGIAPETINPPNDKNERDVHVPLSNRKSIIDGDTIGVSIGVAWNGMTPFDNLGYSFGIEGHQYDFGANNIKTHDDKGIRKETSNNDFEEWSINLNAGLKYTF